MAGREISAAPSSSSSSAGASARAGDARLGEGAARGGYALPSEALADIVERTAHPSLTLSPDRKRVLVMHRPPMYPPVAELALPEVTNMAGMRLDAAQRTRSRRGYATGLSMLSYDRLIADGPLAPPANPADGGAARRDAPVQGLPQCGVRLSDVSWNPSGTRFAFLVGATLPGDVHRDETAPDLAEYDELRPLELWVADADAGRAAPLYRPGVLGCHAQGGINAIMESYEWLDDDRIVATAVLDADADVAAAPEAAAPGPRVEEATDGEASKARTYTDLLRGEHDAATFERLSASQVLLFTIAAGAGPPPSGGEAWPASVARLDPDAPEGRIYTGVDPDHTGRYAIVSFLKRPFSFALPCGRFPVERRLVKIGAGRWDTLRVLADLPLADAVPVAFNATREGPRSISWNPATTEPEIVWAEAQDGGDPDREMPEGTPRDIVYRQCAEGEPSPRVWFHCDQRYSGTAWHEGGETGLVFESWWRTRTSRWWLVGDMAGTLRGSADNGNGSLPPRMKYIDRNYENVYEDPGSPLVRKTSRGTYVLAVLGNKQLALADAADAPALGHREGPPCYLMAGSGQSEEGSRPFVDVTSVQDVTASRRLYRATPPPYESLGSLVSAISTDPSTDGDEVDLAAGVQMWCSREDLLHPSQQYLATLTMHDAPVGAESASTASTVGADGAADSDDSEFLDAPSAADLDPCVSMNVQRVTAYPHPHPHLKGMTKRLVRYQRSDGVELTAKLYLPPGYDKERDGPLPCLVWAYPREFKSKDAASQVRGSPHTFAEVGGASPLVFTAAGYAVVDGPGMPIVGEEGEEPNDTFVSQLVDSAHAVVDHVVGMGVVDRSRVAIAGHSYGAYMSANLLAHAPDLFCCGIARSGAYNRTLTPFGFQSEERTLWDAKDVYITMSPFMYADKMTKPLLLIHGEDDTNTGTFPMQSERMYAALKGAGCPSRLVVLPHEAHGYRGRESILHTVAETEAWLERYCKGHSDE